LQLSTLSLRWHYPDQVEGPPHTPVVLSARLHRAPLADDMLLYRNIVNYKANPMQAIKGKNMESGK